MTAEEPVRPVTARVGAFDNLDAAGQARDELAGRILAIGPRMTIGQVAEAGVSVALVLVPTFRALVWAVLDVADAVREARVPTPPPGNSLRITTSLSPHAEADGCPSRITVDDIRARCSGPREHVGVVHFDFRLGQRWTTDEQDDLPW